MESFSIWANWPIGTIALPFKKNLQGFSASARDIYDLEVSLLVESHHSDNRLLMIDSGHPRHPCRDSSEAVALNPKLLMVVSLLFSITPAGPYDVRVVACCCRNVCIAGYTGVMENNMETTSQHLG